MNHLSAFYSGWKISKRIGNGSFGTVYEIERDLFGATEKAALKFISIPREDGEVDELLGSGYDEGSIRAHFDNCLAEIVREYALMAEMKGHPNIVYCDDVRYIRHEEGFGWDIYIKMELLTPLLKDLSATQDEAQIIKLGKDICSALVLCREKGIVHRDIKPQNIFVSRSNVYKLGDFGIAKTIEQTRGGTKMGTINYMAPEVYNSQPYGMSVDIYSLGMVMYWLLNECRFPFLPQTSSVPTASEMELAQSRRFGGEPVPAPKNGSEQLKQIVLKACAFNPKDRYETAADMLAALNAIGVKHEPVTEIPIPKPELDHESTTPEVGPGKSVDQEKRVTIISKDWRKWGLISVAVLIVALVFLSIRSCGGLKLPYELDVATKPRYEMLSGHCYYIFDEPLSSYEEAVAFCDDLGGFMADVTSEEETMFLHEYLTREGYDHVFLGGTDAFEDGVWKWESGAPFDYQNWHVGEPNNDLGGEDHLAMYQVLDDGSWNDINFETPSVQIKDIAVGNTVASSYCADASPECTPQNISDGDPTTVWCTEKGSAGIGEYVQYTFAREERITAFTIQVGSLVENGDVRQVKRLRLNFGDGSQQIIMLEECAEPQYVQLDEAVRSDSVKVVFDDLYDGAEDSRIALSELTFHTEEKKTGFVCEWEDETQAKAGMEAFEKRAVLMEPMDTNTPTTEPVASKSTEPEVTVHKETKPRETEPEETEPKVTEQKAVLTGITIQAVPEKVSYLVGEQLNTSGLVLNGTYSDGSSRRFTSGFRCDPMTLSAAGRKTIKVTYDGFTASFIVSVENHWSDWVEQLPAYVKESTHDIQEKKQYASSKITAWHTLTDGVVGLSQYDFYDRTEYTTHDSGWSEWYADDEHFAVAMKPIYCYSYDEQREDATQYRYRDMQNDSGEYGEWSQWQFDNVSATDKRQVETREVHRIRIIVVYSTRYYYQVEDGLWLAPHYQDTPINKDENTAVKTRTVYRYREKS